MKIISKVKKKKKVEETIKINSKECSKHKTFVYYEYNNFNKKIFYHLGNYSKKLYNQYIFCFQIYEVYKFDIFKNLYDILNNNSNYENYDLEKIDDFVDNHISKELNKNIETFIIIKNKLYHNNSYIYKKIIDNIKNNNIIIKNSNYDQTTNMFINNLKNNNNIYIDEENYNVLYVNIITRIINSIYNKNYDIVKEKITNHEELPFIDEELINDVKNNNKKTFEMRNHYKELILKKYKNLTGLSDQNIVSKIVRIRNQDIVKNLDSTLVCNIMNKAYNGYKSYYSLRKNGHNKANKPKFIKEDVYNLIYTYSKAIKEDNYTKLYISTYLSKNFNILFPDFICLDNNKYIDKKYLKYIGSNIKNIKKKDNYIIGNKYVPKNNKNIYDTRYIELKIPEKISNKNIAEIEIVFEKNDIKICISYNNDIKNVDEKIVNPSECISIDLGIKNLMTIYDPIGESYIISGKFLSSINLYYNNKIAIAQMDKDRDNILKYNKKRINIINNYFNKLVRWLEEKYSDKKLIIIGYNNNWKSGVNMGSLGNMLFYGIPYRSLLKKIECKFNNKNIGVILQEESYTSKCDSLSYENIRKHETYDGKRLKRGLFSSKSGKLLNADINGAINIMRKLMDIKKIEENNKIYNPLRVNIFCEDR